MLKFDKERAKEVYFDEDGEYGVIKESSYTGEGKYQSGWVIITKRGEEETGPYYRLYTTRSGNHWSGYEWEMDTEAKEVEKKEVTKVKWVDKKPASKEM